MKCAVIVMATLMIIASMLLVGVSLAMAEHIDELGIPTYHFTILLLLSTYSSYVST